MHGPTDLLTLEADSLAYFCAHAPDAILLVEPGCEGQPAVIVACNAPACQLYGYTSAEIVGQPVTLLEGGDVASATSTAIVQAQADGATRLETIQYGRNGRYIDVDLALTRVLRADSDCIVAVVRDITPFKRTERRLTVQHAISSILAEANHFMEAAPRMLEVIATYLGWEVGAMWCVDRDANLVRWTIGWHTPDAAVAEFEAVSRELALPPGVGFPGSVWASGVPRWDDHLEAAPNFSRGSSAARAGLHTGFAFPILSRSGVFGVMEFFSRGAWPPDDELVAMGMAIGTQCGTYIDRRRAQDATHFQAHLLDTVEQAVIATDLAERITYWNRFAERLYGWTAAEAIGQNIAEFIPAPATEGDAEAIMRRLRAGESWSGEFLVKHRDGSTFPAHVTDSPVTDANGQLVGIVGISYDITERKQSEEKLRFLADASAMLASALDYETILAAVGRLAVPQIADWCSINLIDETGAFVRVVGKHVNPVKEAMLNELRQQDPPQVGQFRAMLGANSDGAVLFADLSTLNFPAGSTTPAQLDVYREMGFRSAMIVPVRAGERLLGSIILATDESDRQYRPEDVALVEDLAGRVALALENTRLYQDAQAAIRTRDDFLSIAAHELKTPVTTMIGYSQMLARRALRDGKAEPRDVHALQVIGGQAQRLASLISSLLDVSRIETGHFTLDRRPVDVSALVRQAIEGIQPTLDRHTITYTGGDEPLIVDGDAMRLEQVFQNLLQNAVKYSPGGGTVSVHLEQRENEAIISVGDHGIGIPPDSLAHLFERFYRAPNVTGGSIGVGIGLFVVKQITELHGGSVEVASTEGAGSTFTIHLPLLAAAPSH